MSGMINYGGVDYYLGDRVKKKSGYLYPGKIVSIFHTLEGNPRVVVQCTSPDVAGMLHIYNFDQLEKVEDVK